MENNDKLRMLLDKLIYPGFRTTDENLNKITQHLIRTDVDLMESNKDFILDWINRTCVAWKNPGTILPINVLNFLSNLTSHICEDEETFLSMNFNYCFEDVLKFLSGLLRDNVEVKKCYVEILNRVLKHNSGVQWLISTKYWCEIVQLAHEENGEMFVKCCDFIANLLVASGKVNKIFCCKILKNLLRQVELRRTLSIFHEVLFNIWTKRYDRDELFFIFNEIDNLNLILNNQIALFGDADLKFQCNKIKLLLMFFRCYNYMLIQKELFSQDEYKKITYQVSKGVFDILTFTFDCRYMLEMCNLCYKYWSYIRDIEEFEYTSDNVRVLLENQVGLFQLTPVYYALLNCLNINQDIKEDFDDVRNLFSVLFFKSLHPLTIQYWTRLMHYNSSNSSFSNAIDALKSIIISKDLYDAEYLGVLGQSLIYNLKDVVDWSLENRNSIGNVPEEFMILLLGKNIEIFEKFDLTWRENVEAISVTGIVFNMLKICEWPEMVIIKSLELLNVAISKYMSPGMMLLIDNTKDSNIAHFGPILYSKLMKCQSDDVKIAALKVVQTIASIANTRFTSYRRIVLEANFPSIVTKIVLENNPLSLQISAINCLQEIVQVDEFCRDILHNEIYDKFLGLLKDSTKPEMALPTVILLRKIYENRHIEHEIFERFLETFSWLIYNSPNGDVKFEALKFWERLIENCLTQKGMIDGVFPEVTFSKNLKKIISLDENEIRKCLIEVLNELSHYGCLAVFRHSICSDPDPEFSKKSYELIKKFIMLLKNYRVVVPEPTGVNVMDYDCGKRQSLMPYEFLKIVDNLDEILDKKCKNHNEDIWEIIDDILNCDNFVAEKETELFPEEKQEEEELTYLLLN